MRAVEQDNGAAGGVAREEKLVGQHGEDYDRGRGNQRACSQHSIGAAGEGRGNFHAWHYWCGAGALQSATRWRARLLANAAPIGETGGQRGDKPVADEEGDPMEVRRLGESKVKVSAVTFGAWAIGGFMWGGNDEKDSIAAIRAALDHGIDTIDTAPVYGMGASETIVGKAIEGRRDDVRILTKFGLSWDTGSRTQFFETVDPEGTPHKIYRDASPQRIREECDASLRRLRTDYIDLYQIHWADPDTPIEATFEVVARMIEQGKILAAGVCNYTPEQIEAARKVVPLASCQPPYSMINRGIESDVLPYCRERGIGVVAYSPMQRGLLTGKIDENKEFPASDTRAIDKFFSR